MLPSIVFLTLFTLLILTYLYFRVLIASRTTNIIFIVYHDSIVRSTKLKVLKIVPYVAADSNNFCISSILIAMKTMVSLFVGGEFKLGNTKL